MAAIRKRKTANGHTWLVGYYTPEGERRFKQGFRTKDAAEAWAEAHTPGRDPNTWIDPQAGQVRVDELAPTFFATKATLAASSQRSIVSSYRAHVAPKWGHRQVSSITHTEVLEWTASMADHPVVGRRALGVLAGILDIAVHDRRVSTNVARGVPLPRKPQPRRVYMTPGQLQAFAALEGDPLRRLIVLTLGTTGMRWGELAGLQARDVLEARERIHLHRQVQWMGGEPVVTTLKGHEGRVITAPSGVFAELVELSRALPPVGWLFGPTPEVPIRRPESNGWFRRLVRKAMEERVIDEPLTPHGLRHVAAGLLVGAGANVKTVQRQLGHKSAAMTLDTYADLFDGELDQIRTALDSLFPSPEELR